LLTNRDNYSHGILPFWQQGRPACIGQASDLLKNTCEASINTAEINNELIY
jgi:hypothetical protein